MFGNREQINRNEAEKIVRKFKAEKVDTAISYDLHMRTVEIHKMEKDAILNERLPAFTYIVFCRDGESAKRLAHKLREIRYDYTM